MDLFSQFSALPAFLIKHWALSSAVVGLLFLFAANEWRYRRYGLPKVDPQELITLVNHQGAVVVDIRSKAHYDMGHILGAISIPAAEMESKLSTLSKYKNKAMILVCATGLEAPKLSALLTAKGITPLYYLAGGLANWQSQGMPCVKK